MQKEKLPQELYHRLTEIYSPEEQLIVDSWFSCEKRPVFFRVNKIKAQAWEVENELKKLWFSFVKNDFLPDCYSLVKGVEKDLWKTKMYEEGDIYLQSFSSQIPVNFMELKKWMKVLDLTAAPWWKTSQISQIVWEKWQVVACEISTIRRDKMTYNLKKMGCTNVEVISADAKDLYLKYAPEYFDALLFDAPCSSEWGIHFWDTKFLAEWSKKHIVKNYERQKEILKNNIGLLKQWWILMYSTCTLAPEENEGIVHFILCNYKYLQLEEINFPYTYAKKWIKKFEKFIYKNEVEKTIRIIPNPQSEGFFLAKFKRV